MNELVLLLEQMKECCDKRHLEDLDDDICDGCKYFYECDCFYRFGEELATNRPATYNMEFMTGLIRGFGWDNVRQEKRKGTD